MRLTLVITSVIFSAVLVYAKLAAVAQDAASQSMTQESIAASASIQP
jgi:hypothetical protein